MCTVTPVPYLLLSQTVEARNASLLPKSEVELYFEHLGYVNWGEISVIADAFFEL